MGAYYVDSSALVKRHIEEPGSEYVERLLNDPENVIYVSRIAGAEVVSAITRRGRGVRQDLERTREKVQEFRTHLRSRYRVLDVTAAFVTQAMDLAERHAIRGYDSVHLATALAIRQVRVSRNLSSPVLVSSDDELNAAAAVEGLEVINPLNPADEPSAGNST